MMNIIMVNNVAMQNATILHLDNDNGDTEKMLMSPGGYIAAAITLLLIGFSGFFLNLSVIIIMWKDKQLRTPLNIILFNLVCSDFSVSIFGNPWTFISAISFGWVFGETMCRIYGFFMASLGISSITSLSVLAFERYIIVSRPFKDQNLTRKRAVYLVVGIWMYTLLLTVPPLIGWGKYVNEAANISCSVNWEEVTQNSTSYIIYLFTFGLGIPLGIIMFSYMNIIHTMRKNKFRMRQTSKAERRVTYMILIMILAFLLAWSPYAISALLVQFGDPSFISPAAAVIPALLAKSSICYNPIIYVGLNSQFRTVLRNFLGIKSTGKESSCETHVMAVSKFISQTGPTIVETVEGGETLIELVNDESVVLNERIESEEKIPENTQ